MTYLLGNTYDGQWDQGLQNGQGMMLFADGNKYSGCWSQGVKSGAGKMEYWQGYTFAGQWANDDRLPGPGSMVYANGDKYVGNWDANKEMSGEGTMTYTDGSTYAGLWQNNLRNFAGVMTYLNGDVWDGVWANDYRVDGAGTMTYFNRDVYEGQWLNCQKSGCYQTWESILQAADATLGPELGIGASFKDFEAACQISWKREGLSESGHPIVTLVPVTSPVNCNATTTTGTVNWRRGEDAVTLCGADGGVHRFALP